MTEMQQAQHNEDLRHEALSAPMVALVGSDKQVTWADSIRRHVAGDLAVMAEGVKPEMAERFAAIVAGILGETSAAWWIDNRHFGARDLFGAALKAGR